MKAPTKRLVRYLRKKARHPETDRPYSQIQASKLIGMGRRTWQLWEDDTVERPVTPVPILAFAALTGLYSEPGEPWESFLSRMELEAESHEVTA